MSDFEDDFEINPDDEPDLNQYDDDDWFDQALDELEDAGAYVPGLSLIGLDMINDAKGVRGITFTSPVDAWEWIIDVAGPDYADIVYFGDGLWGVNFHD